MPVTAAEHFNALPATKRIALYGKHLFELVSSSAAAPAVACAMVRLSSEAWTPCESLEQALNLHQGYLERWTDEGFAFRDLASSVGYVANANSHITHWISRNGIVHEVRYLGDAAPLGGRSGPLSAHPLHMSWCSQESDEADTGEPYYLDREPDAWLKAQADAGAASRPRQMAIPRN